MLSLRHGQHSSSLLRHGVPLRPVVLLPRLAVRLDFRRGRWFGGASCCRDGAACPCARGGVRGTSRRRGVLLRLRHWRARWRRRRRAALLRRLLLLLVSAGRPISTHLLLLVAILLLLVVLLLLVAVRLLLLLLLLVPPPPLRTAAAAGGALRSHFRRHRHRNSRCLQSRESQRHTLPGAPSAARSVSAASSQGRTPAESAPGTPSAAESR